MFDTDEFRLIITTSVTRDDDTGDDWKSLTVDTACTARPGLLQEIRDVFHRHRALIHQTTISAFNIPACAMPLFHASVNASVAPSFDPQRLQQALENVEHDLVVWFR